MSDDSKYFMVYFNRTKASISDNSALVDEEKRRFQDLMRENIIQRVFMKENKSKIWLVIKADSEEVVKEIINTLPYCKKMEFEINPLMWD